MQHGTMRVDLLLDSGSKLADVARTWPIPSQVRASIGRNHAGPMGGKLVPALAKVATMQIISDASTKVGQIWPGSRTFGWFWPNSAHFGPGSTN